MVTHREKLIHENIEKQIFIYKENLTDIAFKTNLSVINIKNKICHYE